MRHRKGQNFFFTAMFSIHVVYIYVSNDSSYPAFQARIYMFLNKFETNTLVNDHYERRYKKSTIEMVMVAKLLVQRLHA